VQVGRRRGSLQEPSANIGGEYSPRGPWKRRHWGVSSNDCLPARAATCSRCSWPIPKFGLISSDSFATLALAAGVPAKVVSETLGHAGVAITLDTYSQVVPGMQEEEDHKAAALIFPGR
jgi:hypothetical protein